MLKITVNMDGLSGLNEKIRDASDKAAHIVAVQAMKDTRPYVPMRTGSLDTRTKVVGNKIIYPGPYARFLYNGLLMVDPNTGSPFAQKGVTKVATDKPLQYTKDFHKNAQAFWFEASKAQNLEKWKRVAEKAVKNGF